MTRFTATDPGAAADHLTVDAVLDDFDPGTVRAIVLRLDGVYSECIAGVFADECSRAGASIFTPRPGRRAVTLRGIHAVADSDRALAYAWVARATLRLRMLSATLAADARDDR